MTQQIKTPIDYIIIALCTYKRPLMLKESLVSVSQINIPENIKIEILVVDNDVEKSGENSVKEAESILKQKIHYFVEDKRGICNARNRVLEEVIKLDASHILFFDDDELLEKDCLINHINFYNSNENVFISSGPTKSVFKTEYPNYIKKHMVFKQRTTKKTGCIKDYCAAGNVFFPVSMIKDNNLRFSNEYIFMGGEDGDFFGRASQMGYTIVYNNEAVIFETVPKERANIKYIMKKCHYNGYSSSYAKFKNYNKKSFYIVKNIILFIILTVLTIPSILLGPCFFFNMLGFCFRTKGKIDGAIKNTASNFYNNVYGA